MMVFGFYGFGEAASTFAIELQEKSPGLRLPAYDVFINEKVIERSKKANVDLNTSVEEFFGKADIVGSLVNGSAALSAAEVASKHMDSNKIYVDFTAVSPRVKKLVKEQMDTVGVAVIDAAIMGSVPENGIKVSILLSGEKADIAAQELNALGFRTSVISEKAGDAAAVKMVRSVFAKGLEALFIEMLLGGEKYGVQDKVIDSIAQSLENKSIRAVMNTLVTSQAYHSARKKIEMDYVIEVLKDADINPIMSTATRDYFEWITSLGLKEYIGNENIDYRWVIDTINKINDKGC